MIYLFLLASVLGFTGDYSIYVNDKGQFDLEASFEISPNEEMKTVKDLIEKGFHQEEITLKINKTEDFEIREQVYTKDGGGLKLATKSCKKNVIWFCKELEFKCDVSMSDNSFTQNCLLDFDKKDAKRTFDKSMDVMNTLSCDHQAGKFICKITGRGLPRETLLISAKQLAIGGSTETFRGFFQMQEYLERKSSALPDPVAGAKIWQAHYDESMNCSRRYQVFKILGKTSPVKRTCLEAPIK